MIGLQLFRNINGIALKELSEQIGISDQNISQWEKGKRKIPEHRLDELRDMFKIPKDFFVTDYNEDDLKLITDFAVNMKTN